MCVARPRRFAHGGWTGYSGGQAIEHWARPGEPHPSRISGLRYVLIGEQPTGLFDERTPPIDDDM